MTDLQSKVDNLVAKAADADKADDALKFSQAALNAAHTKHAMLDPDPPPGASRDDSPF